MSDETYPFGLLYPAFFPGTPPQVMPRVTGASRGINTAAAGNSCLEYRADNWDPSVTGAMMMASTYRLLAGERPAADKRALVLSAHHTSLGQELRNVACRFLLTPALRTYVMLDKFGTCDLVIDATADPWDAASARMFVSFRKTEGQRVVINSRHQAMYWCRAACGGGSISGRSRATKTADAAGVDLRPDHGKKRADVSRACAPRFAASPRSFSHRGLLAGCVFPVRTRASAATLRPTRRYSMNFLERYRRFNYLGEWHSHPSFSVQPSFEDIESMTDIVENGNSTITFAVPLIVFAHGFCKEPKPTSAGIRPKDSMDMTASWG